MKKLLDLISFFLFVATSLSGCSKNAAPSPPSPTASFNYAIQNDVPPAEVNFINGSQNAESYHWDFGDNSQSDNISPTHTYVQNGNYTVTLIATSASGRQSQSQKVIGIGAKSMTIVTLTIDSASQVSNPLYFLATLSTGGNSITLPPYYLPYSDTEVLPAGYWNALNYVTSVQNPVTINVLFRFPNSNVNNPEGSNGLSVFTLNPQNYVTGANAYPSTINLVNAPGVSETKLTFNVTWQ